MSSFAIEGATEDPLHFNWLEPQDTARPSSSEALAPPLVLIIEDNPGDAFIMEEAVREHVGVCEIQVFCDGEQGIHYFDQMDSDSNVRCPDIVLLDLNLPKYSGHEVLKRIRLNLRRPAVPVLIVTSSSNEWDLAENQRLGATGYFPKEHNLESFMQLGSVVKRYVS